jgi:solute carrier family 25 (mitochondrial folate transporter), member 32
MQQRTSQALEFTPDGQVRAIQRTEYTSIVMAARRMWQQEGYQGFFKGCLPNALRVAPNAAITFVVYESIMEYFED